MMTIPLHSTRRSRIGGAASARLSDADVTGASVTRPIDAGEVSIAAGVVEVERVILVVAVGSLRGRETDRIWMTDIFEPYDIFAAAPGDAFHRDLGDSWHN